MVASARTARYKCLYFAPMTELPARADVVVVGAGVIGLTTALELARRGHEVCVLERDDASARPCSWAGGGMLSPLPPTIAVPELEPLLSQSLAMYPRYCAELLEETGIDPEYWVCGARWIGEADEQDLPELAQVRNPRLLQALRAALGKRRVPIVYQAEVRGWQLSGDALVGVQTAQGNVACARAVLAAGAWSGQLSSLPIGPAKGQMLLLKTEPGRLPHILIDEQAYLIPRRDGHILLGSTLEDAGFDVTPTLEARAELLMRGQRLWSSLGDWPLVSHWAGLRPRGGGIAPSIEADGCIRGLYHNVGHFRLGITLGPASALKLADLL